MKESLIRKKVIEILEKDCWVCWCPKRVKWQETDIFSVYDLLAARKNKLRFIQFTSLSNISARKIKVSNFLEKHKLKIPSEVWGWNSNKKEFKIISLCGTSKKTKPPQ